MKGAQGGGFAGFDFADALEIFMRDFGMGDVFGATRGRRSRSGAARGPDMRVRLPLTLKEVATGAKRTVKLRVQEPCGECGGSGARPGTEAVTCSTCGGAGEVRRVQRSFLGQLVSVSPCPTCHGEGREVRDPCTNCAGRGLEQKERTIEVEVPAGVSSGDYLTLRGQGHAAPNNGARGDILVVMDVQDDERFSRDGPNLLYELGITFSQAALGADLEVPTVTGNTRVEVPPGTQSGHVIRLRGKGLPQLQGGGRGDLLVRVTVWTPTRLSAEQEKVFRALAEVETEKPQTAARGGDGGFWSRVKEAFGG